MATTRPWYHRLHRYFFGHKTPTSTNTGRFDEPFTAGSSVTRLIHRPHRNNQSRKFVIEAASAFSSGSTFDAGKSMEFQLDSASLSVSDGTKTYRWYNISIKVRPLVVRPRYNRLLA